MADRGVGARDQRAHRRPPPVPGAGRPAHPARALRRLEGLRVAYVGDGNNVAHSLMEAARARRLRTHRSPARPDTSPTPTITRAGRAGRRHRSSATRARPSPARTPSTPTSGSRWATSRSAPAARRPRRVPRRRRADGARRAGCRVPALPARPPRRGGRRRGHRRPAQRGLAAGGQPPADRAGRPATRSPPAWEG